MDPGRFPKDPDCFGSIQPNKVTEEFKKSNPRRPCYALSKILSHPQGGEAPQSLLDPPLQQVHKIKLSYNENKGVANMVKISNEKTT